MKKVKQIQSEARTCGSYLMELHQSQQKGILCCTYEINADGTDVGVDVRVVLQKGIDQSVNQTS